ncbi:MAG: NUDIX hydrolase [Atopobiaceae bacterium]|nr:NUDIX hydrolase [Atopobiaceae bacterium]MCH4119598.1 NUDIX hydrolase [Atopobiaceae bacterium]MCI1318035.1 NUDIX hydrolase [Atopobiaceae bacterium]MCI1389633.1 NUDIX hydrolase [Atopobiaceae bacterium]MCI1431581.1 NUDIX hydrolase [Atopobiaceae bacterium]
MAGKAGWGAAGLPGVVVPESVRKALAPDPALVERPLSERAVWHGSFFDVSHVEVELPNGERKPREIVRHPGGAAVLAVRDGSMCLVRQYRVPQGRVTIEIPAGKRDPGETPAQTAARELEEETGLVASSLEFLASTSGIPGFSDEITRVYFARGLSRGAASLDDDEFVKVVWLPVDDVLQAIRADVVTDVKTVVAVLAYKAGLCG